MSSPEKLGAVPEITLGPAALERAVAEGEYTQTLFEAGAPLSPFHYQLRKVGYEGQIYLTAGLACPVPGGEGAPGVPHAHLRLGKVATQLS